MTLLRSKAVTTAAISAGGVLQLSKGAGGGLSAGGRRSGGSESRSVAQEAPKAQRGSESAAGADEEREGKPRRPANR